MRLHVINVGKGILNNLLDMAVLVLTCSCVQDKLVAPILQGQMLGIVMFWLRLLRVGMVEGSPL